MSGWLGARGLGGLGRDGKLDFFIYANRLLSRPTHIAIASPDRATVHAFHAAGLAASGRDNGPPGLRPHYHQHHYGAFVLDRTATISRPYATGRNSAACCLHSLTVNLTPRTHVAAMRIGLASGEDAGASTVYVVVGHH